MINGPHLVIVPKSTLQNWKNEFTRWCPSLEVLVFNGTKQERLDLIKNKVNKCEMNVLLTTYKQVINDKAHRLKNEMSKLSLVLREMRVTNRLLLTGTPLQNNLKELWSLLNFLLPDIFGSSEEFDDFFNIKKMNDDSDVVSRLHRMLRPFMLRRIKAEVEKSLLPKK